MTGLVSPFFRSTKVRRSLVASFGAVLLAAACEQPPLDPAVEAIAPTSHANVTLTFVIYDSNNTNKPSDDVPVPGAALWLYASDALVGIFNDGMTGDLDGVDNGTIVVSVPAGNYGAMIKKIPIETQDLEFVAPVGDEVPTTITPVSGPIAPLAYVGGRQNPWTCATGASVDLTTDQTPISAARDWSTTVDVRACNFNLLTLLLPGASAGDALYGVISAADFEVLGLGSTNGFDRGILGFVSLIEAGTPPSSVMVCPADGNFAVELFRTTQVGGTAVNLVASLLLPDGCDEPTQATVMTEIARCAVERDPATDAAFGASAWGYTFNRGSLAAGQDAKVIDLTSASVRLPILADGAYSLSFRTTLANGTLQATADFVCAGGACSVSSIKQTGQGNTQTLAVFFTPMQGGVLMEAVMTGIPAHSELTWSINGSNGAKRPLAARDGYSAAYYPFRMQPNGGPDGDSCVGDSNDGTWSVKGL